MPRIELNPEWVRRTKNSKDTRMLAVELDGIQRVLDLNDLYPYRKESEILELKKQKVALQCRIRLLFKQEGVGVNANK